MSIDNLHQIPDPRNVKDIIDLRNRIESFKKGEIDPGRFKHFRLTRGVYGQRQQGVHMFRTKLPIGKLTARQLARLADISEKYATSNLHLTTRQNIQFHYVKIDDATAIWREMAEVGLNAREACGNTVRNVTASASAGIDPHGVGECAGAAVDVIATILKDAGEKLQEATIYLSERNWPGAIYNSYSAMVIAAKALLLADDVRCNTHQKIIEDFQTHYVAKGIVHSTADFVGLASAIYKNQPTEDFARDFLHIAKSICQEATNIRSHQVAAAGEDKAVVADFYRA